MATAFQALPPPGPPPPGVVYPTSTNQLSSHSNGSFGMVFVVLAVILVVSAAACALGRLCNKRSHRSSDHPREATSKYHTHGPENVQDRGFMRGPRMPPGSNERDVEFGFPPKGGESEFENEFGHDKKIPKIKIVPHGETSRGQMMPPLNGEFGGPSIVNQMRMMESPRNFR